LIFLIEFRNEGARISKGTVSKTVRRFEQMGSVRNRPTTGRPSTRNNFNAKHFL